MANPIDALKSGSSNITEAIQKQTGTYKDPITENTNQISKLPQAALPQAPDPTPFTLGPLGGGKGAENS